MRVPLGVLLGFVGLFATADPGARMQPAPVVSAHAAEAPAASAAPTQLAEQPPPAQTEPSLAAFDSDASLPAHADDVADYTLRATLDPVTHTVHGEGTLRWRNTSTVAVRDLWVHLYLNAFKNERSVYLREPVAGGRGNDPVTDWGTIDVRRFALLPPAGSTDSASDLWPSADLHRPGDEDETDAHVPLPREIQPNETISVEMVWDSKLPNVVERTGFLGSFHMVGQWFPKVARLEPSGRWAHFPFHHLAEFYSDFGTYDVTLDVPASFAIGATGAVVESHVSGSRRVERHVQSDIHDFAWTAWDQWLTASETIDGVGVRILYPPGFRFDARRELAAMRFAVPHFREKYGRYPYSVLTLVHPPYRAAEAGGMEYPTLITTGGNWYGPPGMTLIEIVTIHEFGHQWFYGIIATDEVTWPFLDEGLNTYAEAEALGAWRGGGSAVDVAGLRVSDTAVQAINSRHAQHDQPVAQPAYDFTTGGAYGFLVYSRTATILETLRRVYGDLAMSRALGRYARRFRFKHPVPEDLARTLEDSLGPDAGRALRAALFDKGWVDYTVTGVFDHKATAALGIFDRSGRRDTVSANGAASNGDEGWALVTRRGTLAFPVDIELSFENGTAQRVRWDGQGDSIRVPYRGTVPLRSAEVDPDDTVLLDDDLTNNHRAVEARRGRGAPRTFERAGYWAEVLFQMVAP